MTMRFRPHRELLEDSLAAIVTLEDSTLKALLDHLRTQFDPDLFDLDRISAQNLKVRFYGHDKRCDWDCHIVSLEGFGVLGFTDTQPTEHP